MKNCEDILILLEGYLAGELTDTQRAEVEAHLAGCDSCRKELRLWETLRQAPAVPAPPILRRNVMERLRAEHKATPRSILDRLFNFVSPRYFSWGAAAALLAFAIMLGVHLQRTPNQAENALRKKPASRGTHMVSGKDERQAATALEAYSVAPVDIWAVRQESDKDAEAAPAVPNILMNYGAFEVNVTRRSDETNETFYSFSMGIDEFAKFQESIKDTNIRIVKSQIVVADAELKRTLKPIDKDALFFDETREGVSQVKDVLKSQETRVSEDAKKITLVDEITIPDSTLARSAAKSAPAASTFSAAAPAEQPVPAAPAPSSASSTISSDLTLKRKAARVQAADELSTPIAGASGLAHNVKGIQEVPSRKGQPLPYYQVEIGVRNKP